MEDATLSSAKSSTAATPTYSGVMNPNIERQRRPHQQQIAEDARVQALRQVEGDGHVAQVEDARVHLGQRGHDLVELHGLLHGHVALPPGAVDGAAQPELDDGGAHLVGRAHDVALAVPRVLAEREHFRARELVRLLLREQRAQLQRRVTLVAVVEHKRHVQQDVALDVANELALVADLRAVAHALAREVHEGAGGGRERSRCVGHCRQQVRHDRRFKTGPRAVGRWLCSGMIAPHDGRQTMSQSKRGRRTLYVVHVHVLAADAGCWSAAA
ncbi:hypothetical protein ON010_g2174 [Phytophthora cinnamomi]|nr:hypothetical protein ON010_g2174 [Phytophthora cinnamomi]